MEVVGRMTGSFGRAVERREPAVVIDPRDGTVLDDLEAAEHPQLVEVLLELRRREAQMKAWRAAVEDELVRRFGERRASQPVGAFEVNVVRQWRREWDAEQVEAVAADLVNHGAATLTDVADLVVVERKVNGTNAGRLLTRLRGRDLAAFSEAFDWVEKGRPKVDVTASMPLVGP